MMGFDELKSRVVRANVGLVEAGLVVLTWGNASAADRQAGVMAIKPSGVPYAKLKNDDIVVLDIATGNVVEGSARPSSDTPTHLHLYRVFDNIGGVVHTHSLHATVMSQAQADLPCLGTTHADNFYGTVPCTRDMTDAEIQTDYELNTGKVIEACFRERKLNPDDVPGVLVARHAPFAWGKTIEKALENAIVLEFTSQMALLQRSISPTLKPISQTLLDKHFLRKHGPGAYYGQK